MPTINSDAEIFDRDLNPFVHPSQARPERRQVAPLPTGRRSPAVEQIAGKAAEKPCVTPRQWLSQWCCLDEQT